MGIIKLFPPRESLVSDIPAGDGNVSNLFLRCRDRGWKLECAAHFRFRSKRVQYSILTEKKLLEKPAHPRVRCSVSVSFETGTMLAKTVSPRTEDKFQAKPAQPRVRRSLSFSLKMETMLAKTALLRTGKNFQ